MSDPPEVIVKEKNPKRVAAGKKLAERNKMYKEHYEKNKSEEMTVVEEKPESAPVVKKSTNYYVVGVIVLVIGGFVYYNHQSKPKTEVSTPPRPVTLPKPNRLITV